MNDKEKSIEQRAAELNRAALDRIAEKVAFDTRANRLHRVNDASVRCPLCREFFEKMYDGIRKIFVYVCHTDKVGIACADPFVGRWDEGLKGDKIECPACNADMRFFCTSTGYVKAKCPKPKCGATLGTASPDRKPGTTIIKGADADKIDRPIVTPDTPAEGNA